MNMTIPTRPAPVPPVARGQNAAAGANATIEQLRRQLEQQQQRQQQENANGLQKLTIKLPPPPKGATNGLSNNHSNHHNININNNYNSFEGNPSSSITRKFPKARYAPATNWDDSPFESNSLANGNFKKVPPPRPPPPKVQVNGRKPSAPAPPTQANGGGSFLHIFQRKKVIKASSAGRIYGVSSGNYSSTTTNSTSSSAATTNITNSYSTGNWNAAWNTNGSSSHSATSLCSLSGPQEAQLISFDSPPSSPTFTQKSNSDCVSVDSFSSDSNFSSPQNGSVSQPESGFEDDFSAARSRPPTISPLDPWETTVDGYSSTEYGLTAGYNKQVAIGTAPVRNLTTVNTRLQTNSDNPLCNGKSLLPPTPSLHAPTIIKPKVSQKPRAPKPPVLTKPYPNNGAAASNLDGDLPTPPSPPMPQFAPPPPPGCSNVPSMLDVINGKVDALQFSNNAAATVTPYGVALYDFEGMEEGDLSFREGEKIYLLEQVSSEWYRGRTRTGCEGIFPVNYIDVKVPLVSTATSAATNSTAASAITDTYQQQQTTCSGINSNNYAPHRVRCLYNFPAEVTDDLALKENDLVTVLYRINKDWLYGEIAGRQGQFPANFLEYVPDNIPLP